MTHLALVSLFWACRALHIFFPRGQFLLHPVDMDQTSPGSQLCGGHSDPQVLLRLTASPLVAHQTVRMWGGVGGFLLHDSF